MVSLSDLVEDCGQQLRLKPKPSELHNSSSRCKLEFGSLF